MRLVLALEFIAPWASGSWRGNLEIASHKGRLYDLAREEFDGSPYLIGGHASGFHGPTR